MMKGRMTVTRSAKDQPGSGCQQDSAGIYHPTPSEPNREPALDFYDVVVNQLHAVAADLGPARGQRFGRWHPVARQEPCMCAARAWRGAPASTTATRRRAPAENESGAEARRSATDHHHVVPRTRPRSRDSGSTPRVSGC